MNDLAELKDGWGQPDPPSRTAHLAARTALLREIDAARAPAPAPRLPRRRGVRLGWLASGTAVTATAAAAVAFAVVLGPTQPAQPGGQASDPSPSQLSGQQVLLNAAVVAQARPAGTGAYWHVKQELVMPDDPKRIQTLSSWIARDGTHYSMRDGWPGASRLGQDVGFQAGGSVLTLEQLERLPGDPDALKAWMTDSYLHRTIAPGPVPADGVPRQPSADEVLNGVAEGLARLLWEVPTPPAVRSAALRALATMPNVTNLGATDGGQALRISFGAPPADKYPNGKLPPGAGELTLIIDPDTSTLLSSTTYQRTTKILEATWTNDLPEIIPPPTK